MAWGNNFIVFDLETGGLRKKGWEPPITEIAMCFVDNNLQDIGEYSSLIKVYKEDSEYNPAALTASNITLKMCNELGKPKEVVLKEIISLLKKNKTKQKPILVGHNIDEFDIPILDNFFAENGEDLSKYVETKYTIDTLWLARMKYPSLSNFKLGTVLETAGIDLTNAHRAMNDTKGNKDLFVEMMKCLRGEGSSDSNSIVEKFRESFTFEIKERKG